MNVSCVGWFSALGGLGSAERERSASTAMRSSGGSFSNAVLAEFGFVEVRWLVLSLAAPKTTGAVASSSNACTAVRSSGFNLSNPVSAGFEADALKIGGEVRFEVAR